MSVSPKWIVLALLLPVGVGAAGDGSGKPAVYHSAPVTPYRFDGSARDLPTPRSWQPGDPVREIPRRTYHDPSRPKDDRRAENQGVDPLLRLQRLSVQAESRRAFNTPDRNFDGLGFSGSNPPDPVGDVGPNHYVQMINSLNGALVRIYDKASPAPNALATFTLDGLGAGFCGSGFGDPIVLYDRFVDRWMLSEFSSAGNRLCVYISQTPDPTGSYYAYDFAAPTFPDYPKYSAWPTDANGGAGSYVVTTNETTSEGGVFALDRAAMLAGLPATFQRVVIPDLPGFVMQATTPADPDGGTPPPVGAPAIIMRHRDTEAHSGPAAPGDLLEMWHFDVDWVDSANTTLTRLTDIDVSEFESDLCGLAQTGCFPQPETSAILDPLREVIMNRLVYVNLGTHEAVAGNFTVDVDGTDHGGPRWFELRRVGGAAQPWTLHQEGTYGPDGDNRWMGAIAMDRKGNLALAYDVTSMTTFPSLRYTGRLEDDPLNTMTQGETSMVEGSSFNFTNRYGDYSAMGLDPADDCTFWFTGEYNAQGSGWSTRIASFDFDTCRCDVLPLPLTIAGGVGGPNRVDLSWSDSELPGVTEYRVMRSRTSGGPYATVATVADTSPGVGNSGAYNTSDTTVSGGSDYYYIVVASDGGFCTSSPSNELVVTATGVCTLPPIFAGLETLATPNDGICTLDLTWSAAVPECAGPVSYEIHRAATPGFTPGPGNLLATTSATSYADTDQLVTGLDYFYVVRARDDSNGSVETNDVELAAIPLGVVAPPVFADDAGDTGLALLTPAAPWSVQPSGGNSAPGVYTTGPYGDNTCADLVSPQMTLNVGNTLSFWSRYDIEGGWDKGEVQISTNGGGSWARLDVGYPGLSDRNADACGLPTGAYFTGTDTSWNRYEADLSPWDGQTVMFRWLFSSDALFTRPLGWTIDDIEVGNNAAACATASPCADNPAVEVTPDGPLTVCPGALPLLTADTTGGAGPFTYQWTRDGVPISGATNPTFQPVDSGVHDYNVRVKAAACPDEVSDGQATRLEVESAPQFGGIVSATDQRDAVCSIELDWDPAFSSCPGPLTYDVYRSTSAGVVPIQANRIASGVAATGFTDSVGLVNGTPYHYLVRAVESTTAQSDTNNVERSTMPSGLDLLAFYDDAGDTGAPQLATESPWSVEPNGGNEGPAVYSTGAYPDDVCADLTTPEFAVTADTLSFASRAEMQLSFDKGEVQISTDGGTSWDRVEVAYPETSVHETDACNLGIGDFFTGTSGSAWAEYTADLSAYAGQDAMLRWRLSTDTVVNDLGWWVDDIRVFDPGVCSPGSACAENPFVDVTPEGPQTVCTSGVPTLTAALTGGSGPFHYQWLQDGVPIAGANDPTFTPSAPGTADYNVLVGADACPDDVTDGLGTALTILDRPLFAGIESALNAQSPTCTVDLDWSAASGPCPGPITYTVYRDMTTPVALVPGNIVASGSSVTSFSDAASLVDGQTYYYNVQALEGSTGLLDGNGVDLAVTPTGLDSGLVDSYTEGFTDPLVINDWTITTGPGSHSCGAWAVASDAGSLPAGGSGNYLIADNRGPSSGGTGDCMDLFPQTSTTAASPAIDLGIDGLISATLSVEVRFEFDPINGEETAAIEVWDGAQWVALWTSAAADVNQAMSFDVLPYANAGFMVRFDYQGAIVDRFFSIDDVVVTTRAIETCVTGVPGPSPVPAGSLLVDRTPGATTAFDVSWDAVSCPEADYNLLVGDLGNVAGYALTGSACAIGTAGAFAWTGVPPGDLYFLLVGTDGAGTESSWGLDGTFAERNGNIPSVQCGVTVKNAIAVCF